MRVGSEKRPWVRGEMTASSLVRDPVSSLLVRFLSYFQSVNSETVFLTLMRWMMIMTIIIGFFNILPLAIRNGKLNKFVLELKVAQFFEKKKET